MWRAVYDAQGDSFVRLAREIRGAMMSAAQPPAELGAAVPPPAGTSGHEGGCRGVSTAWASKKARAKSDPLAWLQLFAGADATERRLPLFETGRGPLQFCCSWRAAYLHGMTFMMPPTEVLEHPSLASVVAHIGIVIRPCRGSRPDEVYQFRTRDSPKGATRIWSHGFDGSGKGVACAPGWVLAQLIHLETTKTATASATRAGLVVAFDEMRTRVNADRLCADCTGGVPFERLPVDTGCALLVEMPPWRGIRRFALAKHRPDLSPEVYTSMHGTARRGGGPQTAVVAAPANPLGDGSLPGGRPAEESPWRLFPAKSPEEQRAFLHVARTEGIVNTESASDVVADTLSILLTTLRDDVTGAVDDPGRAALGAVRDVLSALDDVLCPDSAISGDVEAARTAALRQCSPTPDEVFRGCSQVFADAAGGAMPMDVVDSAGLFMAWLASVYTGSPFRHVMEGGAVAGILDQWRGFNQALDLQVLALRAALCGCARMTRWEYDADAETDVGLLIGLVTLATRPRSVAVSVEVAHILVQLSRHGEYALSTIDRVFRVASLPESTRDGESESHWWAGIRQEFASARAAELLDDDTLDPGLAHHAREMGRMFVEVGSARGDLPGTMDIEVESVFIPDTGKRYNVIEEAPCTTAGSMSLVVVEAGASPDTSLEMHIPSDRMWGIAHPREDGGSVIQFRSRVTILACGAAVDQMVVYYGGGSDAQLHWRRMHLIVASGQRQWPSGLTNTMENQQGHVDPPWIRSPAGLCSGMVARTDAGRLATHRRAVTAPAGNSARAALAYVFCQLKAIMGTLELSDDDPRVKFTHELHKLALAIDDDNDQDPADGSGLAGATMPETVCDAMDAMDKLWESALQVIKGVTQHFIQGIRVETVCVSCPHTKTVRDIPTTPLEVSAPATGSPSDRHTVMTVQDLVDTELDPWEVESSDLCACADKWLRTSKRLTSAPGLLRMTFSRRRRDPEGNIVKNMSPIRAERVLLLPIHPIDGQEMCARYTIQAMVSHCGHGLTGGHFVTYIPGNGDEWSEIWLRCVAGAGPAHDGVMECSFDCAACPWLYADTGEALVECYYVLQPDPGAASVPSVISSRASRTQSTSTGVRPRRQRSRWVDNREGGLTKMYFAIAHPGADLGLTARPQTHDLFTGPLVVSAIRHM